MKKLITQKKAADWLGISTKTLRKHIRSGNLKDVQIGFGLRRPRKALTEEDLEQFVRQQRRRDTPVQLTTKSGHRTDKLDTDHFRDFYELARARAEAKRRSKKSTDK